MDYQTPGLASVLESLKAYAPANAQVQEQTYDAFTALQADAERDDDLEEGEYDPMSYDPSQPLTNTPQPQPLPQQLPLVTRTHSQTSPAQQQQHPPSALQHPQTLPKKTYPTPAYPPATIITWAPALRHVTSLSASNPDFIHRIRHLISTQHIHERQWHASRLSLMNRLSNREDSRLKLDSVLDSLGGNIKKRSREDELTPEEELRTYDRKVYKACLEMEKACVKDLGKLEVPFFCTMGGLGSKKKEEGEKEEGKKGEERNGKFREEELMVLQGRMIELLEDLCGGEE